LTPKKARKVEKDAKPNIDLADGDRPLIGKRHLVYVVSRGQEHPRWGDDTADS
jgi:hypothetical protein